MHATTFLKEKIHAAFHNSSYRFEPQELYEPIAYSLSQGGKRIRPILTLMACDLFEGDIDLAIPPAIGVEIFHNFTLLHDDIMDRAPLRRGMETVYKKWDANRAILSGDTMLVMAYESISQVPLQYLPFVLTVFNDTARKVCEGQQYDLNFETLSFVTIPDYLNMIRLKTAVLIACCLKVGAIMANAPIAESEKMYQFGENLGIAFQLQDDYLDVFGNSAKFGKEIGGDIGSNKKTFLYIKAFELATGSLKHELTRLFDLRSHDTEEKVSRVKEIYQQLNLDTLAGEQIAYYLNKATCFLDLVKVNETSKKALRELTKEMLHRER
ncbi:MAG: polyprenyl synthetase family protein [Bacteroidales bacterium]|nr:polyprenyl synthetase family protein [Bacteroidales bacterium]